MLFVTLASSVVISTFSPSFSSSIPNSSTNAPRVPEPSSRDTTVMSPLAALTIVVKAVAPITAAVRIVAIFFFMIIFSSSHEPCF